MANRSYKHLAELDNRERRLIVLARFRQERRTLQAYADETGISKTTAINDKKIFMERLRGATDDEVQAYRTAQLEELDELRLVAHDQSISKKDRVTLILSILDREIDLVGSAAPSKSVHVQVDGTGRFHETVSACAGSGVTVTAPGLPSAAAISTASRPIVSRRS